MLRRYPIPPTVDKNQIKTAIKAAIKGNYPHAFCVAGHSARCFKDEGVCTYQLIISPTQSDKLGVITKEEAAKIVKANKMERVSSSEWGRIYEMPGEPFHKMWHGYFGTMVFAPVYSRLERVGGFLSMICQEQEQYAYLVGEDEIVICGSSEFIAFARESPEIKKLNYRTIKFKAL